MLFSLTQCPWNEVPGLRPSVVNPALMVFNTRKMLNRDKKSICHVCDADHVNDVLLVLPVTRLTPGDHPFEFMKLGSSN